MGTEARAVSRARRSEETGPSVSQRRRGAVGELGWGEIAVGGVWPVAVVVDAPIAKVNAGIEQPVELPGVERRSPSRPLDDSAQAFCQGQIKLSFSQDQ